MNIASQCYDLSKHRLIDVAFPCIEINFALHVKIYRIVSELAIAAKPAKMSAAASILSGKAATGGIMKSAILLNMESTLFFQFFYRSIMPTGIPTRALYSQVAAGTRHCRVFTSASLLCTSFLLSCS